MKELRTWIAVVLVSAVVLLGCGGGGDSGSDDASDDGTRPAGNDAGRVVALGEEFVLADLLALGVEPVASTATVADVGFQGLDGYDTEGIEALPSTEPNLERLAALTPDTIVATEFVVGELGRDRLEQLADLVVVPDNASPDEQLDVLGRAFDRVDEATALAGELSAARETAAAATPADCRVSVGTVYPGPSAVAWVAAPNNAAASLLDMGCTLVPSAGSTAPDGSGRVRLSLEQIGLLSAATLVLLQSDSVPGETDALTEIEANPLWASLPAVAGDRVVELDRLGYPGVEGRIRLYDDLAGAIT